MMRAKSRVAYWKGPQEIFTTAPGKTDSSSPGFLSSLGNSVVASCTATSCSVLRVSPTQLKNGIQSPSSSPYLWKLKVKGVPQEKLEKVITTIHNINKHGLQTHCVLCSVQESIFLLDYISEQPVPHALLLPPPADPGLQANHLS